MTGEERELRADAARNYERIVDAAVEAFEETGPETTLEQIAERADISVMTLYRRFGSRDRLVRAVFDRVLATEIEPRTTADTGDPWRDLVGALNAAVEVIVRRPALHLLAFRFQSVAAETSQRLVCSLGPLLRRAIDAGVVRPELEVPDALAVIIMTTAMAHPGDPSGAGRRRYFTLLTEGLRPSGTTLPPLPPRGFPGSSGCGQ